MKRYPPVPPAEDAPPGLFESGHLWIQEQIDGRHLRFRLRESGALQFGGRTRTFGGDANSISGGGTPAGDEPIPPGYGHAVRRVRESFDREALRTTVADVESVVFFGEATVRRAVEYDWDRTPSFLGFDVWDGDDERFLPPDAVEQVYDRLGLRAVNAVRKELRAADFDPESYEVPESAWDDGPAAGVVVRNKTGGRAALRRPGLRDELPAPADAPADELAERHATGRRLERVVADLERRGRPVTVDAVVDRLVEAIAREEYCRLFGESASVDAEAFRSAVAARTQRLLDERR